MSKETEAQHTPTPWRVTHQTQTDGTNDIVSNGRIIAHLGGSLKGDDQYGIDAAFIVRAVNSHEALLNLVKRARKGIPGQAWCDLADKVIAVAESK